VSRHQQHIGQRDVDRMIAFPCIRPLDQHRPIPREDDRREREVHVREPARRHLLVQRREQALIGESADTKANKIEFRVIDPPQVPFAPIAPNRPMLFSGVLVVAIGAAVALPMLLLQFDKSFTSLAAVRALGFPVLGSVSWIVMPAVRRRVGFQIAGLCVGTSILIVVYSALLGHSIGLFSLSRIGLI